MRRMPKSLPKDTMKSPKKIQKKPLKKSDFTVASLHPGDMSFLQGGEASLKTLVEGLTQARVVVLGDVGLDRYTLGRVDRISPEAPVPIVQVLEQRLKLGLAANVADNVTALGGRVDLVGTIGRDPAGQAVIELLNESTISDRGLVLTSSPTVVKERIVSEQQQLLRVDYEQIEQCTPKIEKQILSRLTKLLKPGVVLVIEDYAKGLLREQMLQQVFALARSRNVPVLVDPNRKTPLQHYRGATILTPNRKEAEALSQMRLESEADVVPVAQSILEQTDVEALVMTLGRNGLIFFERNHEQAIHLPTTAQEVFDVSGAGDTVIAVLGMALSVNMPLPVACLLANVAAGVEVGKLGTATVEPYELLSALQLWCGST